MIDIAFPITSRCNLRCPSCPADELADNQKLRHTPLNTCEKIFSRMVELFGTNVSLKLYTFNEPLLHPDILGVLDLVQKNGLTCEISTNLNVNCDLASVLSHPAITRVDVSVSGYTQETYSKGHKGGNISRVIENLHSIKNYPQSKKVHIKFHKYSDNYRDYIEFKKLSEDWGFNFDPTTAIYMLTWDYFLDLMNSAEHRFPPRAEEVFPRLINAKHWKPTLTDKLQDIPCHFQSQVLYLNYIGDIYTCCQTGYSRELLIGNIFQHSSAEIFKKKKESSICKICKQNGLHVEAVLKQMLFSKPVSAEEQHKIEEQWIAFLNKDTNKKTAPVYIYGAGWFGNRLYQLLKANQINTLGFIDDDPKKAGQTKFGLDIKTMKSIPPKELAAADIVMFMAVSAETLANLKKKTYEYCGKEPYSFLEYITILSS
ncbi:radical SAM protein [Maridesulfovibrio sp.]|uniref:radical SAM protein n=1 Tax=Maridesulfovibrio sp. TaxID=2795000 RepID=UPI002D1E3826|nr:radical SAM protein [Maridesulfovibrio sp.]